MITMKIALINVGGNKKDPCQGPIFGNGTFVFIPIKETEEVRNERNFPSYKSLNLNKYIPEKFHTEFAHYDPHFPSLTYGHVKRGFGYERIISSLVKGDILCFYATLKYNGKDSSNPKWIHEDWGTYIIGAYTVDQIITDIEFKNLSKSDQCKYENNPHFMRKERTTDYWISGNKDSLGLFNIAFPLHDKLNNERGNTFLSENFTSSSGNKSGGNGYYRHASICTKNTNKIWKEIVDWVI